MTTDDVLTKYKSEPGSRPLPSAKGGHFESLSNAKILTPVRPEVPTYEAKVAACNWLPIEEVYEVDTRESAQIVDAGLFRVRIVGDCMEPQWKDGELIEFRIVRLDREAWPVGRDCVLIHCDDMVTFKHVYRVDDETVTLYALNKAKYPSPIVVPKQMVTRIAVAESIIQQPRKAAFKPIA